GVEGLELNGSDAAIRKSSIRRIAVEGYDSSSRKDVVEEGLRKHFASRGIKLIHAFAHELDFNRTILCRCGLIYVNEEDEEKALTFDGSDMGGRILRFTAYPFDSNRLDHFFATPEAQDKYRQRVLKVLEKVSTFCFKISPIHHWLLPLTFTSSFAGRSYLNRSICHRFSISIQFHKISTRPVLYPHGIRVAESDSSEDTNIWKFYDGEEAIAKAKQRSCKSVSASVLLRKLRWSTLGLQFDWSKKHAAIAMPAGEEFRPEGAIVNYFGLGHTLGGHLDDMEADWSKPIVSMSLGCKAIFLLGGKSKEDPPHAMYLRSGDVVLMAREARACFHGVPRIFIDEENADIGALESELSHESGDFFAEYIKTSRININIRQVF
ncbi:hypothetical protein DY000_02057866, partial [Brassica cretica]